MKVLPSVLPTVSNRNQQWSVGMEIFSKLFSGRCGLSVLSTTENLLVSNSSLVFSLNLCAVMVRETDMWQGTLGPCTTAND